MTSCIRVSEKRSTELIGKMPQNQTLDASGLKCPLPVLKAKKALKAMAPGEVLTILATDPGAKRDFAHFCEASGNLLLEAAETDGVLTFRLRKERSEERRVGKGCVSPFRARWSP